MPEKKEITDINGTPLQEVESSNVHSHGYDPASGVLRVKFRSGGVYDYHNVSAAKYEELTKAASVGSFISTDIKGKHVHERLNPKE